VLDHDDIAVPRSNPLLLTRMATTSLDLTPILLGSVQCGLGIILARAGGRVRRSRLSRERIGNNRPRRLGATSCPKSLRDRMRKG
jgi:hypothetical protein